jgi:hypothetical protein
VFEYISPYTLFLYEFVLKLPGVSLVLSNIVLTQITPDPALPSLS